MLVGTRKGAFFLESSKDRRRWRLAGPHFLGNIVHHVVLDPRDRRTLLLAARTGHLGPTVFRSLDFGRTWQEAKRPPAFPKAQAAEAKREVDHVFWLSPGHASEPDVWYAGTSPQGLFRSGDGGMTWEGIAGFNENPMREKWTGGAQDGTPDGPKMHSILIDPRDARHLYIGMSSGGVFETRDRGHSWQPLNQGCRADFLPDPYPEYGHDPHCVRLHPLRPDRLYQQNHCGIYRMERAEGRWVRIGEAMPKTVGDIGLPLVLHPRDPDTLWVFPMDGTTVWPRVSPDGKPAVYVTRNGGRSWQRLDRGLPRAQAWWTVKRQAMSADTREPAGIYFGTTGGELWGSVDGGRRFACLARHLPEIYSIEAAGS
ncbi:MAG: glycosyl hydrolase [Betaproteobacteria bacterium]|nr:glycosyl hydrolase [Betaproteobacteria bacterium]